MAEGRIYTRTNHPRWKWRLTRDYSRRVEWTGQDVIHPWVTIINSILRIPENYHWNGTDAPSIDTHTNILPSCVHDACYQAIHTGAMPMGPGKAFADRLFYELCREYGMHPIRAWYHYWAVRRFGLRNHRQS